MADEETPMETEVPEEPAADEPLDLNGALQMVLKKALAHDGLARGINECVKAIERGQGQLCVLAQDCNQPDYVKLVEGLCKEYNVNLIAVPSNETLGEWAGLCKIAAEGNPRKIVKCSVCVVRDYGEETRGLAVLNETLKEK